MATNSNFSIASNDISNNIASTIVSVEASSSSSIFGNTFLNNQATNTGVLVGQSGSATILVIGTQLSDLSHNMFENSLNAFEVAFVTTTTQNVTINGSNCYWGSTNLTAIHNRIYDAYYYPSLPMVLLNPVQTAPLFTCYNVNNCSGHGLCIRQDLCSCSQGYGGTDCSQPSCVEVSNCNYQGTW